MAPPPLPLAAAAGAEPSDGPLARDGLSDASPTAVDRSVARPIGVLFVCLGNICRSPQAEGLFRHHAALAGLIAAFDIDSAGTIATHAGEGPDPRTAATSAALGVPLGGRSRPFVAADFDRFDWIIVMDRHNARDVLARARHDGDRAKVALLRRWQPGADAPDVPDPYYGGADGFRQVFEICDVACRGLLDELRRSING